MSKRYPPKVHEFIKANIEGKTTRELVELVNSECGTEFTESQMKSYKANHKLKSGTPVGLPKDHASSTFPQPVKDFIMTHLQGTGPAKMMELLNEEFGTQYTRIQMKGYYGNHDLSSGTDGRFEKGHNPANKGRKGYHAPGCEKGWFTKGHTPQNKMPIGTEMFKADGYLWVKTGEGCRDWKQKHVLEWEKAHGPIPEGYVLTFKDGNRGHAEIDNLALITMAESLELTRSGLRSNNPEFTNTGILIVKVKRARSELKKMQNRRNSNEQEKLQNDR